MQVTAQKVGDLGRRFSTADIQPWHKKAWLREVIGREYADVEIIPPATAPLFNEMTLYPWQSGQLSVIHSGSIRIERGKREITQAQLDNYFAVLLLDGRYALQQQGKEVFLNPGDITLYDATRPHQIHCPQDFSKLIISIPRPLLHQQLPAAGLCTAIHIDGQHGTGAVLSALVRTLASQVARLSVDSFNTSIKSVIDLLCMACHAHDQGPLYLSRSGTLSLIRVKEFIASHLHQGELDSQTISAATGLSSRYINQLFAEENTSLMRYVWQQRLSLSARALHHSSQRHQSVSEIALASGFNDFSHFSRAFKKQFGLSPRAYRQQPGTQPRH
ncbi:helix-turn-helix domain-containing protein [Methylophilus aquaticus]|uniref:Helix-turn-helix domain-containing protein n=1 Tax=Methylophilus aquaticus TaxID=1971610 RepID=A0ABT9JWI9_9PROT|nr:helix-turn-helix domain-containing protein [Methylophilus aquaticus]MDP8568874.1 helix-turn-helix domain-containing protein [Methylophilus aquaticus]